MVFLVESKLLFLVKKTKKRKGALKFCGIKMPINGPVLLSFGGPFKLSRWVHLVGHQQVHNSAITSPNQIQADLWLHEELELNHPNE